MDPTSDSSRTVDKKQELKSETGKANMRNSGVGDSVWRSGGY